MNKMFYFEHLPAKRYVGKGSIAIRFCIALFIIGLSSDLLAQSVSAPYNNPCVGSQTVFTVSAYNCTGGYSWGIAGATRGVDYTVIGDSNSPAFRVQWNKPLTGISASCNYYNCTTGPQTISGNAYSASFNVIESVTPAVSIAMNTSSYCTDNNLVFTATPTYGGSSPYYRWKVNGTIVSEGYTNTFSSKFLMYNDQVSVDMTSNASCVTTTLASSNAVTINYQNPAIDPTGTVKICSSCTQHIQAPAGYWYQWYMNGQTYLDPTTDRNEIMVSNEGTYAVKFKVNNCLAQSTQLTIIKNKLPIVNACADITLNYPGSAATLTGTATDPDGTITSVLWRQASGSTAITKSGDETYTLSLKDLSPGYYVFALTVTDDFGETASDYVAVKVNGPPNNYNYVITNSPVSDKTTTGTPITENNIASLTVDDRQQVIEYFDGLSRPMQTVTTQASRNKNDVVVPVAYDDQGRETKKYLPYTDGTNGTYKTDALKDPLTQLTSEADIYHSGKQYKFYQTAANVSGDNYPYAARVLEASPLSRVLKQGAPGEAWQPDPDPSVTTDHTMKLDYTFNAEGEVILFDYDENTGAVIFTKDNALQYYPANELFVTRTTDENNHDVLEYKDKKGRVILRKVAYKIEAGVTQYTETYYVYNDLDRLAVVLPPEGVKAVRASIN
ncbi:DUF6443 domain-containing protein [Ohtaekwangia sp.]|uniref:DUF6443 domain-containing protein n=1 Tax=Ohtaekwangia sp. TaxID=2066019 RepID=UPI002FDCFFF3